MRTRGKVQFSRYFQKLTEGDSVAVVREPAIPSSSPKRIQGSTGIVKCKKGRAYVVTINTQGKDKEFILEPVHLKKIESSK